MAQENLFRIILPFVILIFIAHRGYFVKYHTGPAEVTVKKRAEGGDSKFAGLLGLAAFIFLVAYVVDPSWLVWAKLFIPVWVRWIGVAFGLLGFGLLQWAQLTLGSSWSDTPRMMKDQRLITTGPYRFIRHPIYAAFLLIFGSTLLISANLLVGFSWLGMTLLEIVSRIRFEENLMLEYFGRQYREYMNSTGSIFPRLTG